jgi:cytochrome bd-type quinol oxidase subunit 1
MSLGMQVFLITIVVIIAIAIKVYLLIRYVRKKSQEDGE